MKLLKNSLLLVAIAFFLDNILVFATPQKAYISVTIPAGGKETTNYKTKTSTEPQRYTNSYTNTPLTSPCKTCYISVKFESKNGDYTEQAVRMENTITCNNSGLWNTGEYRIQLRRSDLSLISTYTSGVWEY